MNLTFAEIKYIIQISRDNLRADTSDIIEAFFDKYRRTVLNEAFINATHINDPAIFEQVVSTMRELYGFHIMRYGKEEPKSVIATVATSEDETEVTVILIVGGKGLDTSDEERFIKENMSRYFKKLGTDRKKNKNIKFNFIAISNYGKNSRYTSDEVHAQLQKNRESKSL